MSEICKETHVQQLRGLVDQAILDTDRISRQPIWYPIVVASVIVAGTTVTVLMLSWLLTG